MHYVYTDNNQEQKQLELEFSAKNSYYLVPNKQSYFVIQMLSSICFEFFQSNTPLVAQKIKEMLINSFNSSYCLTTFRQIMSLLKKERDEIKLFKDYLVEMNKAFAQSSDQIGIQMEESQQMNCDGLFSQTLKGQSHLLQNLEQLQLPIYSQLQIKCDSQETKTDKTMQSDLCSSKIHEVTPLNLTENVNTKLTNFFSQSSFNREEWKTDRKPQEGETKEESKQLSQFKKRGSTIIASNKDLNRILIKQLEYDLTRQMNLTKNVEQKKHIEIEKYNYQKKIKSALVNYKLKLRKK